MKRLKISSKNISLAKKILGQGGVLTVPTETVYGFSCNPYNEKAIKKIYQIKGRDFNKPLLLVADNFLTVKKYFKLNKLEKKLAEKYWPGAVTIILTLKHENKKTLKHISKTINIAVRVSGNKIMRELANFCGGFITSTSANISGGKECLSGRAVYQQFKNKKYQPDLILDSGKLKTKKPSTIIKVEGEEIKILRPGEIKIKI
ncbi:MAG TPA: L-threonylcarbamoyladenylate synthase [bacterium]|nr:L-threonylcarbamoyladenylate synthase [bacterium]HPL95593.1 L-threonylcarbamoyladenylate synthase [bacterium]